MPRAHSPRHPSSTPLADCAHLGIPGVQKKIPFTPYIPHLSRKSPAGYAGVLPMRSQNPVGALHAWSRKNLTRRARAGGSGGHARGGPGAPRALSRGQARIPRRNRGCRRGKQRALPRGEGCIPRWNLENRGWREGWYREDRGWRALSEWDDTVLARCEDGCGAAPGMCRALSTYFSWSSLRLMHVLDRPWRIKLSDAIACEPQRNQ